MKIIRHAHLLASYAVICTATLFEASAQSLRTAYFSDSYIYRHRLNPAISNEDSYSSLLGLGNLNVDYGTNEGVNTFIVPYRDKLVTFMHESVAPSDFLSGLSEKVRMQQGLDLTLFSIGKKSKNAYQTFELRLNEQVGIQLPKDLFSFMKESNPDKRYNFSDMRVVAKSWADLSYGYSFSIKEKLRIGVKAKFLLGLGIVDADIERGTAFFGEDEWSMQMKGKFMVGGAKGTEFNRDENDLFNGIDDFKFGVAGYGVGFDLGATYDLSDITGGLKLSASVCDIGLIRWSNCANATNDGKLFTFTGFDHFTLHDEDNHIERSHTGSLSDQWHDIREDLEEMYNLKVDHTRADRQWLAATVHIGVEYELPSYRNFCFGLLLIHRFSDVFGYNEARLNVNLANGHKFDMAFSGAYNTYGTALGAMFNIHLPGFNIFFGSDRIYFGKVNKYFIPLDQGGMNLQWGINFPFGK